MRLELQDKPKLFPGLSTGDDLRIASNRLKAFRFACPMLQIGQPLSQVPNLHLGQHDRHQNLTVVAHQAWGMAPAEIAADYDLTPEQVTEALAFYEAHRGEIEA